MNSPFGEIASPAMGLEYFRQVCRDGTSQQLGNEYRTDGQ
jgi:hypothetical protein